MERYEAARVHQLPLAVPAAYERLVQVLPTAGSCTRWEQCTAGSGGLQTFTTQNGRRPRGVASPTQPSPQK